MAAGKMLEHRAGSPSGHLLLLIGSLFLIGSLWAACSSSARVCWPATHGQQSPLRPVSPAPHTPPRYHRHGTPVAAIALSSLGILCLTSLSFVDIVELLNAIYCLAELLEFAAYIWLRIKAPNLPRPYKCDPALGVAAWLLPSSAA